MAIALDKRATLFYFLNDSLESFGAVHGEVGEHLAVDFDTGLMKSAHQLRVGQAFQASGSVDTLNPQCAEVALLSATVAIGIGETLLPGVLGDGPDVLAGAVVTAGEFQNSFSLCP